MKRIRNHVLKAICKNNCGNIDNKIEIVGYVTVFIYKIRGTPRSVGINRQYQEKYPYLEFFTINVFLQKTIFLTT